VKSGKKYELLIWNITSQCVYVHDEKQYPFNIQSEKELGGSSANHDLLCSYFGNNNNVEIEIKRHKTPDWMQCSLYYDKDSKKWRPKKEHNKIPNAAIDMYEDILDKYQSDNTIFKTDLDLTKKRTMETWREEKKDFKDVYFQVPNDFISKLYSSKGCKYIQISDFGLYHLQDDVCNFGTKLFDTPSMVRIRVKYHKTNKDGSVQLSVMISACPIKISLLKKSNISFDNNKKLPEQLIFIEKKSTNHDENVMKSDEYVDVEKDEQVEKTNDVEKNEQDENVENVDVEKDEQDENVENVDVEKDEQDENVENVDVEKDEQDEKTKTKTKTKIIKEKVE
jgi:hypothetical protein